MNQYFEVADNKIPLEFLDLFKEVSGEFNKKVLKKLTQTEENKGNEND